MIKFFFQIYISSMSDADNGYEITMNYVVENTIFYSKQGWDSALICKIINEDYNNYSIQNNGFC